MNTQEFECKYLKLQGISEQKIESELLSKYIEEKFKWNKVKTQYFLEKNQINDLISLIGYDRYPQW